jgi:hypothetical protein
LCNLPKPDERLKDKKFAALGKLEHDSICTFGRDGDGCYDFRNMNECFHNIRMSSGLPSPISRTVRRDIDQEVWKYHVLTASAIKYLKADNLVPIRSICNRPPTGIESLTKDFDSVWMSVGQNEVHLVEELDPLYMVGSYGGIHSAVFLRPGWFALCHHRATGPDFKQFRKHYVIVTKNMKSSYPKWISDLRKTKKIQDGVIPFICVIKPVQIKFLWKQVKFEFIVHEKIELKEVKVKSYPNLNDAINYLCCPYNFEDLPFMDAVYNMHIAFAKNTAIRSLSTLLKDKQWVTVKPHERNTPCSNNSCTCNSYYPQNPRCVRGCWIPGKRFGVSKNKNCCAKYAATNARCKNCQHDHTELAYNDKKFLITDWRECTGIVTLMRDELQQLGIYSGERYRQNADGQVEKYKCFYIRDPTGIREIHFDFYLLMWISICLNNPGDCSRLLSRWLFRELAIVNLMNSQHFGMFAHPEAWKPEHKEMWNNILSAKNSSLDFQGPNGIIFNRIHQYNKYGDRWRKGLDTYDPFSKFVTCRVIKNWLERTQEAEPIINTTIRCMMDFYNNMIHMGVKSNMTAHLVPLQLVGSDCNGIHVFDDDGNSQEWSEFEISVGHVHRKATWGKDNTVKTAFRPASGLVLTIDRHNYFKYYIVTDSEAKSIVLLRKNKDETS